MFIKGYSIRDDDLNDLLNEADNDRDGVINFNDFFKVMKKSNIFDDSSEDELIW